MSLKELQKLLNAELTCNDDDRVQVTEVFSFVWRENGDENIFMP